MGEFTHLHLHTQYSILDGAAAIKPLIARVKELGMTAVAITDHGNMFGVKAFHKEATDKGIKPILGCEVYVAASSRFDKSDRDDRGGDHLILLAKNPTGYHNLMKIVSYAWTEGYYYKPRIDKELLTTYHEGIICSSACLGGEIPQLIMQGHLDEAENSILWFKKLFGDDYYLEFQLHKIGDPERDEHVYKHQKEVNRVLLEFAEKHHIQCIATNDVHFIRAEDAPAHDRLICLNTGKDLDDPTRMRYTGEEYLKSYDQMLDLFPDHPEFLATTNEIAAKVEVYGLDHKPFMPNFPLPEDFVIPVDALKVGFLRNAEKIVKAVKDEQRREALRVPLESLKNEVANAITVEELEQISEKYAPQIEGVDSQFVLAKQFKYLEHLTWEGAHVRYESNGETLNPDTRDRIQFELDTVEWMGFPGYFLIVWDFIHAARQMGVSVGPGRGSAAGSVVAYCLTITNLDPIKYGLLFERFLNPERISMPDIDIDFDEDGRADVMKYVVNKYGQKRVAQIITFGTMAAKMAIKDVARVQKLDLKESNRLAKLVPETPGMTLAKAYKESPELASERESDNELIRTTLSYAETLEGSVRQTGVHACGVIIGKDDLEHYIPLATQKEAELYVVQYDGKHVEDVGLLKMDFLGLKTLSIIKDALDNIKLSKNIDLDIETIPLDDELTYKLYSQGDTTGIFQFESPGMKKYLRSLKPGRIEDIIAMNALYRPGPIEYIPNFIARKQGEEPIEYDLPEMEEVLNNTYGITVYQEQVMLLSQKLAGFTKGQADTLRKAMGKKKIDVLQKMKGEFIKGAGERGHDAEKCEKIWHDWEKFAQYAFNKSHSTCYAWVSYQTAYLKAHYPAEFMAALLSRNLNDIKKISFFMDECKRMGLQVLGPDVNESLSKFSVDSGGNVRFGMEAIKGAGEAAVKNIIEVRRSGGRFTSIYDFMERVNLQSVNKKCMEVLCMGGAFDSISGMTRGRFFAQVDAKTGTFLEQLVRYGQRIQVERDNSQQSLFGASGAADVQKPVAPAEDPWGKIETLNREKEVVGIYLSSHPLDDYAFIINRYCNTQLSDLSNLDELNGHDFSIAGMITKVENLFTKSGKPYGRFTLEDYSDSHEFTLFSKDYEEFRKYLYDGYYILIKGIVHEHPYRPGEIELKIESIAMLDDYVRGIREFLVAVNVADITPEFIDLAVATFEKFAGEIPVKVKVIDPYNDVVLSMASSGYKIKISNELLSLLDNYGIKYAIS